MYMNKRNTYIDYTQYLRLKNTEQCDKSARDYDIDYNRAFDLSGSNPTESVSILKRLYSIKKNPEVLLLLQELRGSNTDC